MRREIVENQKGKIKRKVRLLNKINRLKKEILFKSILGHHLFSVIPPERNENVGSARQINNLENGINNDFANYLTEKKKNFVLLKTKQIIIFL
jgi:hypothetical protein